MTRSDPSDGAASSKPDAGPPNREHWARLQDVFHAALALDPVAREAYVRTECASQPELVDEVLALLEEDAREAGLLDRDVGEIASDVLDDITPHARVIGRYTVERVLGRGGMGVVYLATRDDIGLKAAVKVLRDAALSPNRRARFVSEQRTLAGLSHPRIARLYDADLLGDDTPYFVMEYVDGEALDRYCARRTPTVRERLGLLLAICEAVAFAHGRAVIHRDLKPSNIMVSPEGEPKLLDFGIAKHMDTVEDDLDLTKTGLRMMTPAYAAPEQLLGQPVGVYTDVYALGVILYELLTGLPPFDLEGLTPAQAERTVLETDAAPPSRAFRRGRVVGPRTDSQGAGAGPEPLASPVDTVEDATPRRRSRPAFGPPPDAGAMSRSEWADLDVLCSTAMHRDVSRRYASAEALARDVRNFLSGAPLEARPDTRSYRAAKFARRHARPLAFGAVAATVLASTAGFYTWRLAEARDVAIAEADRARRIQAFTERLFQGGDAVAGPADTLRVLTLLERGVQEAGLLSADPRAQSDMVLTLAGIYGQLGRFERADSLLGVALSLRESVDPVDPGAVAEARAALGELRIQMGAYDEAATILTETLTAQRAMRPRDDLAIATTLAALGVAFEGRGEYDPAIASLEEAIAGFETHAAGSAELSAAIAALATTYFYAGDLDASDSLNLRALEIDRRLHGDGHPSVADGLINLAASETQRGRYPEAERLFREALAIFERYHGPDHPETASALRMLGNDLIFQARLDEAEPLLTRALAIQEGALSPEHPRLANTMGDLAYIHLQNDRHDEAVALYERIVDIYRIANGERHYFVAIGLSNLANALAEGGRLTESRVMFDDVVERFTESRGADHMDTGIARIKLGRVLLGLGDAPAAEDHLLAGYEIVSAQAAPTVSWLRAARSDLITVYEALARPDRAEYFRQEQVTVDSAATGS